MSVSFDGRVAIVTGAGTFASARVTLTPGLHIGAGADAAERVAAHFAEISSRAGESVPESGGAQAHNELARAMAVAR